MNPIVIAGISTGVIVLYIARRFIGGMFGLYRIVPVNEAHIRILNNKKEIFSSREGCKSSYWFVPFMTKLHKLPLCNLAIPVNDIKLNDKDMAKFVCDIMCFINIDNIDLAVERLSLTDTTEEMGFDFNRLSEDLKAIMESIARTTTTKQTILDIYKDRSSLDSVITKEVENVFPKWGIKLVDLELKDLKDVQGSSIIQDIEKLRAAEVHRDAEIKVAETSRDAQVRTAVAIKEAEIAKAEAEEVIQKRRIEKDKAVATAEQEKNEQIAQAQAKANHQAVEALRVADVGKADVAQQVAERQAKAVQIRLKVEAEGTKEKLTLEAAGAANKIKAEGQASAEVIKMTKMAEADGTTAMAEALQKYNDAAKSIRQMEIDREVLIEKFKALSGALKEADLKLILTAENAKEFFGLNLNGLGGANLQQFLEQVPALKALVDKVNGNGSKA